MPDRDGDHMYRIKSPLEEYERVVKEDLLIKSNGYLPDRDTSASVALQLNHTADSATRVGESASLDHLVGAAGQGQRDGDAERLCIAKCCARAASGQAAVPPISAMNERRFTDQFSPVLLPRKDSTARYCSRLLRCGISIWATSAGGHSRPIDTAIAVAACRFTPRSD